MKKYIIPLSIVGILFFVIGFALGINGLIAPFLKEALQLSSGMSYLVITATFLPFVVFGYPSALIVKKVGYKNAMALSFVFFAIGLALFIPSANQKSFLLFLVASFISGMGNALLQTAINPYVTIIGPIESAAQRMSMMGILNKAAWAIAPLFLAIFMDVNNAQLGDILLPFYIIVSVFIALGVMTYFAPLPEVVAEGEEDDEVATTNSADTTNTKTSVYQYPHLILGAVALMFTVGAEVLAMATIVDYATELGLKDPAVYTSYTVGFMVLGYLVGMFFIPKKLSQSTALKACGIIGLMASIIIMVVPEPTTIWAVAFLGLANSLLWPAIWPLAIADLSKFTKVGSSILAMAIVGGAIIPTLFGFLRDTSLSTQSVYWILCLPTYLFITFYAFKGYKIRK